MLDGLRRLTSGCFSDSGAGCAGTGGRFSAAGAIGASRTRAGCSLCLLDGSLSRGLFIPIPMTVSTLVPKRGTVCGNSVRTELRGVVSRTRSSERDAVPEMKEDSSEPAYKRRLQTTVSCCPLMMAVVNVREKA